MCVRYDDYARTGIQAEVEYEAALVTKRGDQATVAEVKECCDILAVICLVPESLTSLNIIWVEPGVYVCPPSIRPRLPIDLVWQHNKLFHCNDLWYARRLHSALLVG
jgi:hypothetical protein